MQSNKFLRTRQVTIRIVILFRFQLHLIVGRYELTFSLKICDCAINFQVILQTVKKLERLLQTGKIDENFRDLVFWMLIDISNQGNN